MRPAAPCRRGTMAVLVLVENEAPGASGAHAAKAETSYMLYLLPELVDMDRLKRAGRMILVGLTRASTGWGPSTQATPTMASSASTRAPMHRKRWAISTRRFSVSLQRG